MALVENKVKPVLKWAGGKSQLLVHLREFIPKSYNKYVEPFFGGGSFFFDLLPKSAVLSDSNPELINLYKVIQNDVISLINELKKYRNDKDFFYRLRKKCWLSMEPVKAAARTIYLNKTCFNGLYRVNKEGGFNVPFANYKNPQICNSENLMAASNVLKDKLIICKDYKDVLLNCVSEKDFIFLDPPYLPISEYSDFKRYTKKQFREEDHIELANIVKTLSTKNCSIVLTNSNHKKIIELYDGLNMKVVQTKRNINCKGNKRVGEDLIVTLN